MTADDRTLAIEEFALEQAVVEIRYPFAYALWDRAGATWGELSQALPDLKAVTAQPNKTVFKLDGDKSDLVIEVEQSRLTAHRPDRGLAKFAEVASVFFGCIFRNLEISSLKRVGLRLIYFKRMRDQVDAADAVLGTKLLAVPPAISSHLTKDDKVILPEYSARIEGKAIGTHVRVRAESRTLDFEVSPDIEEIKPYHDESHGVVLDVDYYTSTTIPLGKLNLTEWILNGLKVTRRDANRFLGSDK